MDAEGNTQTECSDNPLAWVLLSGIVYPFTYEIFQLRSQGVVDYFTDSNNFSDQLYIWLSILMTFLHVFMDPENLLSQIVMVLVIILSINRTFKILRIFKSFSPIVTMLNQVVIDLQQFMLFYSILICLFSILWMAMGIGNNIESVNPVYAAYWAEEKAKEDVDEIVGDEYEQIGTFFGNIVDVLRTTMGDYKCIELARYLEKDELIIFWLAWMIIVIVGSIIFLNFIIAEASASYEKVSNCLNEFIAKEKTALIAESETMTPNNLKNSVNYPKFVVIRQQDF